MRERCPFCWSQSTKHVGPHPAGRSSVANGYLRECEECERWYWWKRQTEATPLFRYCLTSRLQPERCYDEIRAIVLSAGRGFPKRRLAEFNHLCAECPSGRFLSDQDSGLRREGLNEGATPLG